MNVAVGVDFGTTNSLVTAIGPDWLPRPYFPDGLPGEEIDRPHPSVVHLLEDGSTIVGFEAKKKLADLDAEGQSGYIRSPKSLLGRCDTVLVQGVEYKVIDIVSAVFGHLRSEAEKRERSLGDDRLSSLNEIVLTVPVNMKGPARALLRQAAAREGFRVRTFVHEPLAALYGHLRKKGSPKPALDAEENDRYLVFDWGGGTLDLTLCEIRDGHLVQVASMGTNRVGGDKIDQALFDLVLGRHLNQYPDLSIKDLDESGRARLLEQVERAKIQLAAPDCEEATIIIARLFPHTATGTGLYVKVSKADLREVARPLIDFGLEMIDLVIEKANWPKDGFRCLPAGGTCEMDLVKSRLRERFLFGRLLDGARGDTIISEGAAWIARDGCRVSLAKGIFIKDAKRSYVCLMEAGRRLPQVDEKPVEEQFSLWCVDPKEGYARVELSRPADVEGRLVHREYGQLATLVDDRLEPLSEGVKLTLEINADLILRATLYADTTKISRKIEIEDLEFCLELPGSGG